MAYRRAPGAIVSGLALVGLGATALAAWQHGIWGTLIGAALAIVWLLVLGWWAAVRPRGVAGPQVGRRAAHDTQPLWLMLDQVPVPLLKLEGRTAHALNRAARTLFVTDDRVLPAPEALADPTASHLHYEGRRWRIHRVEAHATDSPQIIAALIDIEVEARAAEARAAADMIHVLGHELLNGLAPVVSLAESGRAALESPNQKPELLKEILGTLARRAEGLLRFSEAYRALARLPEPCLSRVGLSAFAADLERLFVGRWGDAVALEVEIEADVDIAIDRDQMTQAVWALLQNGAEAATDASGDASVRLAMHARGERLSIEVTDTGAGVAKGTADRIFRPFHTTKPFGTGIGLSLARQIVHAHGGELTLAMLTPPLFRMLVPMNHGFLSKPG